MQKIEEISVPSYFKDQSEMQWVKRCIDRDVYTNISSLFEAAIRKDIFLIDDIENMYVEERENYDDGYREVFEWYIVSNWLVEKLREINQPVLDNEYGSFWGRTCTGQAIELDGTFQEIYRGLSK